MTTNFSLQIAKDREALLRKPNFSAIARQEGVTPGHVRRVYFGLTTSARISAALVKAVERKSRERRKRQVAA